MKEKCYKNKSTFIQRKVFNIDRVNIFKKKVEQSFHADLSQCYAMKFHANVMKFVCYAMRIKN